MSFFLIVVVVFFLDQLSKLFVVSRMQMFESIPVFENIFHLTLVPNYGAAFGLLPNRTGFLIAATIVVVVLILVYVRQVPSHFIYLRLGLALQLGGALGNLADRIRLGYVVDFFDFQIWPIFNIADMAVVLGVFFLLKDFLFIMKKRG